MRACVYMFIRNHTYTSIQYTIYRNERYACLVATEGVIFILALPASSDEYYDGKTVREDVDELSHCEVLVGPLEDAMARHASLPKTRYQSAQGVKHRTYFTVTLWCRRLLRQLAIYHRCTYKSSSTIIGSQTRFRRCPLYSVKRCLEVCRRVSVSPLSIYCDEPIHCTEPCVAHPEAK